MRLADPAPKEPGSVLLRGWLLRSTCDCSDRAEESLVVFEAFYLTLGFGKGDFWNQKVLYIYFIVCTIKTQSQIPCESGASRQMC